MAAHLQEGVLLLFFQQDVHVVGEEFLIRVPKDIAYQIRQSLKPGAHAPVPPEIADPGHQDVIAFPCQCSHMAQIDFQGQAGFVDGQGSPLLQDFPVGGIADGGLHAKFLEKGPPQDSVAVIQHRPGEADDSLLLFHNCIPISFEVGGRACGPGRQGIITHRDGKIYPFSAAGLRPFSPAPQIRARHRQDNRRRIRGLPP